MFWNKKKLRLEYWSGLANEFTLAYKISQEKQRAAHKYLKEIRKNFSPKLRVAAGGDVRAGILLNHSNELIAKASNPDGGIAGMLNLDENRNLFPNEIEEIYKDNVRIFTAFNDYDLARSWRPHDMEQIEKRGKITRGCEVWAKFQDDLKGLNLKSTTIHSAVIKWLLIMAYET